MSTRRLLLDAGNTRLKWGVVESNRWLALGNGRYEDLSELSTLLAHGMRCYIASVARAAHEDALAALLSRHGIEPDWLAATANFGELVNAYSSPPSLGVDRWMAVIAARERSRTATLIVSVGTAMTVDALSADGRFLGGLIVPGIPMMQRALLQGTARLAAVNHVGMNHGGANQGESNEGEVKVFPTATSDAVQSGIVAALCGAIQTQYAHLERDARMPPRCVLTGGDAGRVAPHLDLPVELTPNLVLEGMERVTRESRSI